MYERDDAGHLSAQQSHDARVLQITAVAEKIGLRGHLINRHRGPVGIDGVDIFKPRVMGIEKLNERADKRGATGARNVGEREAQPRSSDRNAVLHRRSRRRLASERERIDGPAAEALL